MVRRLIDEGHVNGEDFYQIGLNSVKPSGKDMKWMHASGLKFHFMQDIYDRGWKAVMDEILADIEKRGKEYVFVSVDTDVLEPAYVPGIGTPEPGGLNLRELFPMLRASTIAHNVIGMELVEVNPLVETTYRSRQVAVRILRELMTGIALRKQGITDPYYSDPKWIRHTRAGKAK
jgi:agmatinase